ncbi:Fic family protein [Mycobacterium tuberculosis]|uniref:Fic family protein n=1 Tax=Mycobacterium tuberculosis TaxID=1773 RepID=UPI00207448C0|nr:Fic family protein [Mycobacterium tuberculosis]
MHTDDWTGRQLGIVVHADLVRIHPFTDGNGRTTRLLADLVCDGSESHRAAV